MSPPTNTAASLAVWRRAWSAWARSAGLALAWANQPENPAELRKPYVRLQVLSIAPIGLDEKLQAEVQNETHVAHKGLRQIVLSTQVVANPVAELEGSAWAWADKLVSYLDDESVSETLRQAGLSVDTVGPMLDLSALEQGNIVARVSVDVTFTGVSYRVETRPGVWVERIIGEGDVEGNPDPEIEFDVTGP